MTPIIAYGRTKLPQRSTVSAMLCLLGALASWRCNGPPQASLRAKEVLTAVRTVKTLTCDAATSLAAVGTVSAAQTVVVRPLVDGRLVEVRFAEGQKVRHGQVLAQLDLRPFELAVRNARGVLARDRIAARNAQLNLMRSTKLRAEALVSEQAVTDLQASYEGYAASVAIDEAALAQAEYQREQATIVSPFDGVVGVRRVDAGNVVRAGDDNGLVVVTQLDPAAVIINLPDHARGVVAAQMARAKVEVRAFVRDEEAVLAHGELVAIDNQVAAASGTVRVKAMLQNHNNALWPGQYVKVRLSLASLTNLLVVPAAAVQRGPTGTFVYVVASNDVAQVQPIKLLTFDGGVEARPLWRSAMQPQARAEEAAAAAADDWALVAEGLSEGQEVVVDGQLRLRPGSKVTRQAEGAPP